MNIKNLLILLSLAISAHSNAQLNQPAKAFNSFEGRLLDAYWKQHTSAAISVGYGRYYENLKIPDPSYFASTVSFSKQWLASLHTINLKNLNENNKISSRIIENQGR